MTFEIRDRGKAEDELTPEQLAELNAAVSESERGEGVPVEEVLRELYDGNADQVEHTYIPTAEEEADIEAGFAEIERGEWIDGDEFLRDLRHRLDNRGTLS